MVKHNTLYRSQIQSFYTELNQRLKPNENDAVAVVVSHMVPNALSFLPALNEYIKIAAVLPKPKSIDREEYAVISGQFTTHDLDRNWTASPELVLKFLKDNGLDKKRLVFVDIGGYFSDSICEVVAKFDGKVLGILEGTENGIQKYETSRYFERAGPSAPPLITVARSPLKLPEDYLVASGVVFSIEAVLRQEVHEIIETRRACVIGYGRVGSSIAHILRGRGIATDVFDTDPIKLAEAAARGFVAHREIDVALRSKTVVVCATGNQSLSSNELLCLENGCCVASVTSADDEFDFTSLSRDFQSEVISNNLTRYQNMRSQKNFLLLAEGNAANFVHGAVIGPAMQLIEGEKIAAVKSLVDNDFVRLSDGNDGLYELNDTNRRLVAETWNKHFLT